MGVRRLPPLNALRAFEAVSRHRRISSAAHELSVTPSAVTHLVRRLEDDLEVKLVKRSGRNILLTDWGEQLGPELQAIFRSLNRVVAETRSAASQSTLTVSLRPYFAVKWLAPRLGRFWARYPGVELRLHHTNRPVDFLSDQVDLAIEWSKGPRPDVIHHLLIPGELTPVFSPQLPNAGSISKPADLLGCTLLKETDYDSWQDWFSLAGIDAGTPQHALYVDDGNVRHQAAVDGQGVELGCRSLVGSDVSSGRLVAPFDLSVSSFAYFLVEPVNARPTAAAQRFRDWLLREVDHEA